MNINEIMTASPAVCLPTTNLADVAKIMVQKNCIQAPWNPAREAMRFVKTDFVTRKGSEIN